MFAHDLRQMTVNLLHKCLCRQTWNHRREISYQEREREREGGGGGGRGRGRGGSCKQLII
jgi:hypothetical protein